MLFRQEDLAVSSIDEAANILNDAVYLTESESFLSPKAIPVVENTRIGAGVVNFEDVYRLAEENGVDYIDAMQAVAEANEIDPEQLAVAVDEADIIADPWIVNELANVVIRPVSEDSTAYQFCSMCLEAFLDTEDEYYLDIMTEADARVKDSTEALKTWQKSQKNLDKQNTAHDKVLAASENLQNIAQKAAAEAANKPKTWLAAKIASLRSMYAKLQNKWNMERDKGKAGILKKIGSIILNAIDKLAFYLQKGANHLGSSKDFAKSDDYNKQMKGYNDREKLMNKRYAAADKYQTSLGDKYNKAYN